MIGGDLANEACISFTGHGHVMVSSVSINLHTLLVVLWYRQV